MGLQFVRLIRQIVDSDKHADCWKLLTTKTTWAINKSQGQVIGNVNFGKVYQVKLTYQLR